MSYQDSSSDFWDWLINFHDRFIKYKYFSYFLVFFCYFSWFGTWLTTEALSYIDPGNANEYAVIFSNVSMVATIIIILLLIFLVLLWRVILGIYCGLYLGFLIEAFFTFEEIWIYAWAFLDLGFIPIIFLDLYFSLLPFDREIFSFDIEKIKENFILAIYGIVFIVWSFIIWIFFPIGPLIESQILAFIILVPVLLVNYFISIKIRKSRKDTKGKYYLERKYDKKIKFYLRSLDQYPMDAMAWNNLGYYLYLKGEYEAAIKACNSALEINKKFKIAWATLSEIYNAKTEYDKAIEACQKVLDLSPNGKIALYNLGIAFYGKNLYDKSITYIKKAVEIDPKYYQAWYFLAKTLFATGSNKEAIEACNRCLKINRKFKEALNLRESILSHNP